MDECNVDKKAGRVSAQSLAAASAALDDCLGPWSSGGQFNSTKAMCMNGQVVTTGYNSMDCSGAGMVIPMDSGAADQCLPIDISGTVYGGYIRECVGQSTSALTGTLQNMVYTNPGCQGLPVDSDSAGVGVCFFDYEGANTTTPYIILTANATAINVMKCSDNACSMNCVSGDSILLKDLGSCYDGSKDGPLYTGLSFKSMYVPLSLIHI